MHLTWQHTADTDDMTQHLSKIEHCSPPNQTDERFYFEGQPVRFQPDCSGLDAAFLRLRVATSAHRLWLSPLKQSSV